MHFEGSVFGMGIPKLNRLLKRPLKPKIRFQTAFFNRFIVYSTVTDLAKLRGLSTSVPRARAAW